MAAVVQAVLEAVVVLAAPHVPLQQQAMEVLIQQFGQILLVQLMA
jgi:hypothetical protein